MAISVLKSMLRRLRCKRPASESRPVKCFTDCQREEEAFDTRDRGLRTVPLDRIVGSVGRYQDFDERFRLKQRVPSERLERIKAAMRQGRPLPPVKLYQIKDEYYVLDGNHRIAAAKEMGHDDILATIVEFIPSAKTLENILYHERSDFSDRTGNASIELSEVGQYEGLLKQIEAHGRHLEETEGRHVDFVQAAADWYKTIYRPLCGMIQRGGLLASFPGRSVADLYAYISFHQWQAGRERQYGIGLNEQIPKSMEAFRDKMANVGKSKYPEMKRGITAFVLMNVQGKREIRIIEKLFELDEVREIHSVHGDIDLLVKVELTRDLLSSDAEVISQFVHEKVRQVQGVNSTKTLIPGLSRVKPPVIE